MSTAELYLITIFLKPQTDSARGSAIKLGPYTSAQEAERECENIMTTLRTGACKPYRYERNSKVSWVFPEQLSGVCYDKINPASCGG